MWVTWGTLEKGYLLALTGDAAGAVERMTPSIAARRSMGSIVFLPAYLSALAKAHADLVQLEGAWRCLDEAMTLLETTKTTWCKAEVDRTAGEIALLEAKPDLAKAQERYTWHFADIRDDFAFVRYLNECVAKLGQWAFDRPK